MAKIKMPISAEQWRELDTLTKRANQRFASMGEEQRRAVSHYQKEKFSRAKPTSVAEYNKRMRDVERFLASKQTTKRGWAAIKKKAVKAAGKTLRKDRQYELTDDELANIFEEINTKSKKHMYTILDLVQAKKYDAERKEKDFDVQKAVNSAVRAHMGAGAAIDKKEEARDRAVAAAELRESGQSKKKSKKSRKSKKRKK